MIKNQLFLIIKDSFGLIKWKNEEINNFATELKRILATNFIYLLIGGIFLLYYPLIFMFFMETDSGNTFTKIISFITLLLVFSQCLFSVTPILINILKDILVIQNEFVRDNNLLIKNVIIDRTRELKKGNIIKVILIILFLVIFTFTCNLIFKTIVNSNYVMLIGGIMLLLLVSMKLYELVEKKRKYKLEKQNIIVDNKYLLQWEDEICEMCQNASVYDVEIIVEDSSVRNAYAICERYKKPKIIITRAMIEYLFRQSGQNSSLLSKFIKIIIGHELIHLKYKDNLSVNKRVFVGYLSLFLTTTISMLLLTISTYGFIKPFICIFLLFFMPDSWIICNERYWRQISELRADRLGIKLSGCNPKVFSEMWQLLDRIDSEMRYINDLDESNVMYKFYKRYLENEDHPNLEYRIKLINLNNKWSIMDYVKHMYVMSYWIKKRKGWNGK
ncbi:M48 family metalloprotease [Candidatus Enterococcus ikei]|uniref:M48 family metalloprotease n=1 Tax=Candidatus Enterococcus ikei TaxID=2815326 RepID=A0ABS3GUH1_9ENTE|nr:M48 family metalloprotease [Enterococcus sp. DIV0869a]MBO0438896.1 M48 family metalloprotease [Enterococcus sp. DIV0869a]